MTKRNVSLLSMLLCVPILLVSCGTTPDNTKISDYDIKSVDETLISYFGENYSNVLQLIATHPDEFQFDNGVNHKRGVVENPIVILGREYTPVILTDGDNLTGVLFVARFDRFDDAIPDTQKLAEELTALYGSPSSYPLRSGNLTTYLENDERIAPASNQTIDYTETWTVRDNFNETEDTEIETRLSLTWASVESADNPQFSCRISLLYHIISTAYRSQNYPSE